MEIPKKDRQAVLIEIRQGGQTKYEGYLHTSLENHLVENKELIKPVELFYWGLEHRC